MKGDASRVQTSAQLGLVRPDPVPRDPRDVVGDGRRLAIVAKRVRREPSPAALSPLESHVLDTARRIRRNASDTFAHLCGVKQWDRDRVFGELLAYRSSVGMLAIGLPPGETRRRLRAIEVELTDAIQWAIEAGPVAR